MNLKTALIQFSGPPEDPSDKDNPDNPYEDPNKPTPK